MEELNTVETVEVENVTDAPVVSDSMKASTAFGLGALAMGLLGGAIQGGVYLYKKISKKVAEKKKLKDEAKAETKQLIGETNEFSEFDEPEE